MKMMVSKKESPFPDNPRFFRFHCFSFGGVLNHGICLVSKLSPGFSETSSRCQRDIDLCRAAGKKSRLGRSKILEAMKPQRHDFGCKSGRIKKVPTGTIRLRHHAIFSHHIMHLESRPLRYLLFVRRQSFLINLQWSETTAVTSIASPTENPMSFRTLNRSLAWPFGNRQPGNRHWSLEFQL